MITANERSMVEALAQRAVCATHPEELPLFPVTASAYFDDPQYAVKAAKAEAKDEMLGFGVDIALAVPAVTTAALWVAQEVVRWLGSQAKDALEEESASLVRGWIQRLLRAIGVTGEPEARPAPEPLAADQLARVRQLALQKARTLLPEPQAAAIADAIVTGLVLPPAPQ